MKKKVKKKTQPKNQVKQLSGSQRLFAWLDENILLVLSGILLAFIPLYPKIPLFDIIPGYIVRVRTEDLLILVTLGVFFVQLLRKKISLKTPLTKPILAYAVVGLLSVISAILIIHTVPLQLLHVGKTTLHYLRYLEYFSLFFITYVSVKSKKDLKILFAVIVATLLGVVIYGVGQKYLYWPVYSTMNREFSKGIRLYLTEHARVQSTFAGHYDLGAWLVIILPLVLSLAYGLKNRWLKLLTHLIFWSGVWLLVVSAARTSFIAFGFAMFVFILVLSLKQKSFWSKTGFFFSRSFYIYGLTLILMLGFGHDLQERLAQVIESNPQAKTTIVQLQETKTNLTKKTLIALHLKKPEKPKNGLSTDEAARIVLKSDQRPVTKRPSDVYVDIPDKVTVATRSAEGKVTVTTITKERTYSANAMKYGLSVAIRLDALWPQAIKGFLRNPLTGSGYATLNKQGVYQFTEADGTDNNYLRTLGETGLLGFIIFYGIIIYTLKLSYDFAKKTKDKFLWAITIGFMAGSLGLLLNATYIDVFAASKVAMTYWAVVGLVLASFKLKNHEA